MKGKTEMNTKTYATDVTVPDTAYDGRDRVRTELLYEQLGWLRSALEDDAPAIAPGLCVERSGVGTNRTTYLMVDMYRTAKAGARDVPYDERYARIGALDMRPSDSSLWELDPEYGGSSQEESLLACEETIGVVIECVARAIAEIIGGGARVVADAHGHATVTVDHTIATPAPITHTPIPVTIAILRDDARALTAAAVSESLMACHADAASQAMTDAWPEITLYAPDGETVLASVDYSPDHDDAVVLTGPAGDTYIIWTGAREPVDWRDEDDVIRPVCDAVRKELDANAA